MSIFSAALEHDARRSKRRRIMTGVGLAAILLVGLGAFALWSQFFRDDAPPPASLEAAVSAVDISPTTNDDPPTPMTSEFGTTPAATPAGDTSETPDAATPTSTSTSTDAATSPLDGQWTVTASDDAFVGYRIGEELATIGTTEAVGRTSQVTGSATIEGQTLTAASITADMTTLTSDEGRRDQALQRQGLETNTYPTATFELTAPADLPESLANGEAVSVVVNGTLTLHGVSQAVDMPLNLQLTNDTLVVVGSLDILLADYKIEKPSAPIVASVNDAGVLELQLFFAR